MLKKLPPSRGKPRLWRSVAARYRTYRGEAAPTPELPALHRLAILYLALPLAIWLVGWLEWWIGIPATLLLALSLWKASSGSWRPNLTPPTLVLALFGLGWALLTPAGGFAALNAADWINHRAVLLDLGQGGWPTYLTSYVHDEPPLLRYYLGWYIAPGLLGKWLGPAALNWAVPLWTWGGFTLLLLLFTHGLPTLRAALLAAVIFLLFGGLDLSRVLIYEGIPDAGPFLFEQWGKGRIHFQPDWGPSNLDVQAILDTSTWSPQHIIPGGIAPLLLLQLRQRPRFLAVVGIVLTTCLFWSTLLSIALLALASGLLAVNRLGRLLTWQNLLAAPLLAGTLAIYLASSGAGFQTGWLWEVYDDRLRMALDMMVFYTVEFGALAFLLWRVRPQTMRDPFFFVSLAILCLVYWFYVGHPRFSELSIRMAVPAVTVLAFFASRAVVERLPEMSGGRATTTSLR